MSTEDFSPDFSDDAVLKYDEQSSIGADIMGGAVASVVDFGASFSISRFNPNIILVLPELDGNQQYPWLCDKHHYN